MMLPTSLSLLNAMFVGKERRIAFAIWGSTIGGTAALGPLLGGWLTTDFSWRWAFGINIPLALIVIIGSLLHVTESRGEENSGRPDIIGALLSVVGVGSIVFALIEGRNYGWIRPRGEVIIAGYRWEAVSPSFAAFVVGAIAVIAFIIYELRRNRAGKLALLDLSLFSIASFRNGNIAAAIVSLGEFGLLFALPLFLQNVRVLSAFETGKILLALAIGSFVASGGAVQLTARLGAVMTVRVGIALEMIGVAAIGLTLSQRESLTPVIAALFVYGMGVGLATAQLTSVVLAEVPTERGGQASGTASTMRQLGSALGIAILGAVLFGTLTSDLTTRVEADKNLKPYLSEIVPRVENSAGSIVQAWRTNPKQAYVGNVAAESFLVATQRASYAGAAFLFVGLLATLRLRNVRTAKEEFVENESDDVPARTKGNSHGRVKKQPKSRSAR
jgi:MFS family permease